MEEDCLEGCVDDIGFCWLYGDSGGIYEMIVGYVLLEMVLFLNKMGVFFYVCFM